MPIVEKRIRDVVGTEQIRKEKSGLVVSPQTAEEISGILKIANETRTPVIPRGGGTGWWSSTRPRAGGILLSLSRLNRILHLDEDAMTVTAQAGMTFHQLEEQIGRKGFRIIIFPESGKTATIGGHIETWGTSPYTSSIFEDQSTQVVGLKIVLPTGEILPIGSNAVTKAAGNFARRFFPSDLGGLFLGAEGAFGIIAEAAMKIHRIPEAIVTKFAGFSDLSSAVAVLRKIQDAQRSGGLLTLVEQRLVPREMLLAAIPHLLGPRVEGVKFFLSIRGDGESTDVENHIRRAGDMCTQGGGAVMPGDFPEWWEGRYGFFPRASLGKGPRILIVAMIPLGKYEAAAARIERFGAENGLALMPRGYPFGGPIMLVHASIRCADASPEARKKARSLGRELMGELMDLGCIPHRVGSDFLPTLIPNLDPGYYGFVKRIKRFLDPNGILNPGVVVAE